MSFCHPQNTKISSDSKHTAKSNTLKMLKPPPSTWHQTLKTHKAFQVSVCINKLSKQSCLIEQHGAHAAIKYSVQHRSHSGLEGTHRSPVYHNWRLELLAWKLFANSLSEAEFQFHRYELSRGSKKKSVILVLSIKPYYQLIESHFISWQLT